VELGSISGKRVDRSFRIIEAVGVVPTAILTFVTMLLVAGEIIVRLVFNHSFYGLPDLAAYFMLVFAFWPLGAVEVRRQHLRTEVLLDMLGQKKRLRAERILNTIGLGLMAFATAAVVIKWVFIYETGEKSPTLLLPLWPFALSMVIGFVTLCVALALHTLFTVPSDDPLAGEGVSQHEGGGVGDT